MCKVIGCKCTDIRAKEYCSRHYNQIRKYGRISDRINKGEHEFIIKEDYAIMILYDKYDMKISETFIDIEDIDRVKQYSWGLNTQGRHTHYCKSNNVGQLHRFLLNVTDSNLVVDHINHNGLDNRKCNLRICTNQQNICNCKIPKNNKSGCKGVYWSQDKQKWTVQVTINNKTKYIGRYDNLEDAINARREASRKYYGDYANDEEMD